MVRRRTKQEKNKSSDAKVGAGSGDVVTKIKSVPTGAGGPFPTDVPKTAILINSATLVK